MPAKDIYHDLVKEALQKEAWQITHDPYRLSAGGAEMFIDLGAEKLIAAEKQGQKIAVEIKSFLGYSQISDFYTALGQFLTYKLGLQLEESDRVLYLAVSETIFREFFSLQLIETVIEQYQINLIIFSIERGAIAQWI